MRQLKITQKVTKRDEISVEKYLADISPIPLITAEREAELAYRIRINKDKAAHNELVRSNLRFVVSVAKQYQGQGLSLGDLISEGNLGLAKAAGRFDETRGFKFISYAVWWIRQHIMQGLSQQGRVVRLPQNKIAQINKVRKATSHLEQSMERDPTAHELSEYLDTTLDEVNVALANQKRTSSLDSPIGDAPDSVTRMDLIEDQNMERPDDSSNLDSLRQDIDNALKVLTPRERIVVKMLFGLGYHHTHTLEEIAEFLDVSRERARQIKDKGLRRLRLESNNSILKQHLG